jgi:hypothetical protein
MPVDINGQALAVVAGALTGLLFVAVSAKSDVLSAAAQQAEDPRDTPRSCGFCLHIRLPRPGAQSSCSADRVAARP